MEPSKEDNLTKSKTLYEASLSEIAWKNFLAGFSRTFGSVFVYLIFLFILGSVFIRYAMPIISPFIEQLSTITQTLQKFPRF